MNATERVFSCGERWLLTKKFGLGGVKISSKKSVKVGVAIHFAVMVGGEIGGPFARGVGVPVMKVQRENLVD